MDENATENNCFWSINVDQKTETARSQNEVFLYDEAEPLAYRCSETSLPPKITSKEMSSNLCVRTRDGENMKTPSDKSVNSAVCCNKSEYYSVQSLPKLVKNVPARTTRRNEPEKSGVVGVNNFQNAILCKYNEFSNSSKSIAQRETEYFKNSADECENTDGSLCSVKIVSRKQRSDVKEIFTRRSPIFVTSSDSEVGQSLKKQVDEEFSTGVSEIADEVHRVRGKTTDRANQLKLDDKNSDVRWLTSKSTVKMIIGKGGAKTRRETRDNTIRVCPPQRKLSIKHITTSTKPCCLFVEEIKRNNLVMKEDIFSSSKNHVSEEHLRHKEVDNEVGEEGKNHRVTDPLSHKDGAMEVYEAKGCSGWRASKTTGIKEQHSQSGLFESAPVVREVQFQQTECTGRKTLGNYTEQVQMSVTKKKFELPQQPLPMKSVGINTDENTHPNSLPIAHNSNESKSSKAITPISKSSRYVKLPGFPEAFVRDDKYVQELRIKDGLSFESVNIFNTSITTHDPSQPKIRFQEERTTDGHEDVSVPTPGRKESITEMKDESTGFESPMEHRVTQTSEDVLTVDTFVQCESHIIDAANGSSDYKNDHQEILVCDDDGTGVQLYNILGHPLTDMEGYLLKDSHGRFLVRFDNFGVPTTCTDGKTIFLEDGTKWEYTKGSFNIIHQRFKKNIPKSLDRNKMKNKIDHRAKRPFGNVKKVSNKLEWLGDISKYDTSDGNSSQYNFEMRNDQNPLRKIKFKPDSTNTYDNTSTLVAEMKSIAKLRNALLEKINFIADHRGPQKPRFSTRNETRSHKSMMRSEKLPNSSDTNWKSEPRIDIDKGSIQRNSHKLKFNINVGKRDNEESFFKSATTHRLHSPRISPPCVQESQEVFPETAGLWRLEPVADLHTKNNRWQPQPMSSNELTILRDENFPSVSDQSSYEPWSDVSRSNSHFRLMTEQAHKWSAMRPSIECSEENGF